jgi:glycosyltransferase involved in cell wall biosynthesis
MRGKQSGYIKNSKYFKYGKSMNERDRYRIYGTKMPIINNIDDPVSDVNQSNSNSTELIKINESNNNFIKNFNYITGASIKQSIIISYKESSEDRKINLIRLLNYLSLLLNGETEIIIVEQDSYSKIDWLHLIKKNKHINHIFIKNDNTFNKGLGYNVGAMHAKSNNLIFNDADLFLELKLYQEMLTLLDKFDVVSPYKNLCYLDEKNSDIFVSNKYNFNVINGKLPNEPVSVISGGIFIIKKEKYLEIKGFDEDCYGWGYEDVIFDTKIKKLGLLFYECNNIAIHIYHKGVKTENLIKNDKYFSFQKKNFALSKTYEKMNKAQLFEKINNTNSFGEGNVVKMKRNIKISIVTAYYNRKKQFYQTLKSIAKSKFTEFELIVVDDCSLPEHRLEEYLNEFSFLNIIRLEKENRWYINPCVPFNIGIREAIGDIIILQNPECLHVHDILTYVNENINDSNYITISAYSVDENITNTLPKYCDNNTLIDFFKTLPQQSASTGSLNAWYNHSKYRPVYYHFCSAITKINMKKLNGFDERYAYGVAYDDDEFIKRIERLGLIRIINDDISVIHQYHPPFLYNIPNNGQIHEKNKRLFYSTTMLETKIKAN